jgi:hypothetical protein
MCVHMIFIFWQKSNAHGVNSLSFIQKCTSTIIMLTYGLVVNHAMNIVGLEKTQSLIV